MTVGKPHSGVPVVSQAAFQQAIAQSNNQKRKASNLAPPRPVGFASSIASHGSNGLSSSASIAALTPLGDTAIVNNTFNLPSSSSIISTPRSVASEFTILRSKSYSAVPASTPSINPSTTPSRSDMNNIPNSTEAKTSKLRISPTHISPLPSHSASGVTRSSSFSQSQYTRHANTTFATPKTPTGSRIKRLSRPPIIKTASPKQAPVSSSGVSANDAPRTSASAPSVPPTSTSFLSSKSQEPVEKPDKSLARSQSVSVTTTTPTPVSFKPANVPDSSQTGSRSIPVTAKGSTAIPSKPSKGQTEPPSVPPKSIPVSTKAAPVQRSQAKSRSHTRGQLYRSQSVPQSQSPSLAAKPKVATPVSQTANPPGVFKNDMERIAAWKQRFKEYNFYLYDLDAKERLKLKTQILSLGGRVSEFMNTNMTHFVSTSALDDSNSKASSSKSLLAPPSASLKTDPAIAFLQKNPHIKRWTLSKLMTVIQFLSPETTKGLVDALRNERIYGISTHRDEEKVKNNFIPFKGPFILVEEPSGNYRPVVCKEFDEPSSEEKTPPWPIIHFEKPSSRSVFLPHRDSSDVDEGDSNSHSGSNEDQTDGNAVRTQPRSRSRRERDEDEESGDENESRQGEHTMLGFIPGSAASGLISGSVTTTVVRRDPAKDRRLIQLGQRLIDPIQGKQEVVVQEGFQSETPEATQSVVSAKEGPILEGSRNESKENKQPLLDLAATIKKPRKSPSKKRRQKRKSKNVIMGMAFYTRPGYCENCNVRYPEYEAHIRSKQHRSWADTEANFVNLDKLFTKISRDRKMLSSVSDFENPFDLAVYEPLPPKPKKFKLKVKAVPPPEVVEEVMVENEQDEVIADQEMDSDCYKNLANGDTHHQCDRTSEENLKDSLIAEPLVEPVATHGETHQDSLPQETSATPINKDTEPEEEDPLTDFSEADSSESESSAETASPQTHSIIADSEAQALADRHNDGGNNIPSPLKRMELANEDETPTRKEAVQQDNTQQPHPIRLTYDEAAMMSATDTPQPVTPNDSLMVTRRAPRKRVSSGFMEAGELYPNHIKKSRLECNDTARQNMDAMAMQVAYDNEVRNGDKEDMADWEVINDSEVNTPMKPKSSDAAAVSKVGEKMSVMTDTTVTVTSTADAASETTTESLSAPKGSRSNSKRGINRATSSNAGHADDFELAQQLAAAFESPCPVTRRRAKAPSSVQTPTGSSKKKTASTYTPPTRSSSRLQSRHSTTPTSRPGTRSRPSGARRK